MEPVRASKTVTALRRGTVAYCVLALLQSRPRYGFELVKELEKAGELLTSQGTIYPLLSRLRGEGLVSTTWEESRTGPPRRYYELTQAGEQALEDFSAEWVRFRDSVDSLLNTRSTR